MFFYFSFNGVLKDFNFGDIEIKDHFIHTAKDDRRYLVTHGDKYDNFITRHEKFSRIISKLYNSVCGSAISRNIKKYADRFVEKNERCEHYAINEARELGLNGVICGHTHLPKLYSQYNIRYANAGDWTTHCSAIVEHEDGKLELVFHKY